MCSERGLPTNGKRQALAERLYRHRDVGRQDGKATKTPMRSETAQAQQQAEQIWTQLLNKQREAENHAVGRPVQADRENQKHSPLDKFLGKPRDAAAEL